MADQQEVLLSLKSLLSMQILILKLYFLASRKRRAGRASSVELCACIVPRRHIPVLIMKPHAASARSNIAKMQDGTHARVEGKSENHMMNFPERHIRRFGSSDHEQSISISSHVSPWTALC